MDHSYFKDRISAYHDRDLPPYELRAVEEHLEECAECRALLAEFEKLERLIDEKSALADDDYWERSAQKIEEALGVEEAAEVVDIRPKTWRGLGWKIAAVAASLAVVTFIGLHRGDIFKEQSPEKPVMMMPSPPRKVSNETAVPQEQKDSIPENPAQTTEESRQKDMDAVSKAEYEKKEAGESMPLKSGVAEMEKATTTTPKPTPDVTDETELIESKRTGDTAGDEPILKVISKRDIVNKLESGDSAAEVPSAAQLQEAISVSLPKEKADRSMALTRTMNVGATATSELSVLRQQRDSLMELYRSKYADDMVSDTVKTAVSLDKATVATKVAAPDSTAGLFERDLVDVHYRIAQLSDDEQERAISVRFLRAYAERSDAPYKERAREHLKALSSGNR